MGYYLETDSNKSKAAFLIAKHGAIKLASPEFFDGDFVTVCVVDNGPFEAAGIAFDKREMDRFKLPDDYRPKIWLKVPLQAVFDLVGDKKGLTETFQKLGRKCP